MSTSLVALPPVVPLRRLLHVLSTCRHTSFPVTENPAAAAAPGQVRCFLSTSLLKCCWKSSSLCSTACRLGAGADNVPGGVLLRPHSLEVAICKPCSGLASVHVIDIIPNPQIPTSECCSPTGVRADGRHRPRHAAAAAAGAHRPGTTAAGRPAGDGLASKTRLILRRWPCSEVLTWGTFLSVVRRPGVYLKAVCGCLCLCTPR